MTVSFAPFDVLNPYQRELARHLAVLGVRVLPHRSLRDAAAVDRTAADIVHLHWLPRVDPGVRGAAKIVAFLGRLLSLRLRGRRIVWTVHNLHAHEARCPRGELWLARLVARIADRLIVHSPAARTLVGRALRLRQPAAVAVVPHGHFADSYPNDISIAAARTRLGLSADAHVALVFGNIRPYKGIPELLETYRAIAHPRGQLLIVGKASASGNLAAIEQAAARDRRVRLHVGFVPDADVQLYMNAADIVVLPYHDVLTSGAVLLAMSFGKACVAPATGCIPDVLNADGAFLYDAADPHGLRRALSGALGASRQRLAVMGSYNLARARTWPWDQVASATAAVYAATAPRPGVTDVTAPAASMEGS